MNPDLQQNFWSISSPHSLYEMVGRNPRSIDENKPISAHDECKGSPRESDVPEKVMLATVMNK